MLLLHLPFATGICRGRRRTAAAETTRHGSHAGPQSIFLPPVILRPGM